MWMGKWVTPERVVYGMLITVFEDIWDGIVNGLRKPANSPYL